MQSKATNANSNRIYSSSERLDSRTAIIPQKHRAREEPSKLCAADYVERNEYAKRAGDVLVEAFNASRSVKATGVNLRVLCENSMRCVKPSVTNFVSRTEGTLRSHSGEALRQCRQYTRCVSRTHQAKGFKHTQNHRLVKS